MKLVLHSAMGDIWREVTRAHPDWSYKHKLAMMLAKARKRGVPGAPPAP